uniref:Uncharacterized protein n=1 Tax=Oryza nivara TaxID=4536 RepID=A0A0E0III6_ORYNI
MVRLDCDAWCSASGGGGGGSVGSGSNEGGGAGRFCKLQWLYCGVVSGVPLAAIQKGVGVAIASSFVLLFCPVSCSTSYKCLGDGDWMVRRGDNYNKERHWQDEGKLVGNASDGWGATLDLGPKCCCIVSELSIGIWWGKERIKYGCNVDEEYRSLDSISRSTWCGSWYGRAR